MDAHAHRYLRSVTMQTTLYSSDCYTVPRQAQDRRCSSQLGGQPPVHLLSEHQGLMSHATEPGASVGFLERRPTQGFRTSV